MRNLKTIDMEHAAALDGKSVTEPVAIFQKAPDGSEDGGKVILAQPDARMAFSTDEDGGLFYTNPFQESIITTAGYDPDAVTEDTVMSSALVKSLLPQDAGAKTIDITEDMVSGPYSPGAFDTSWNYGPQADGTALESYMVDLRALRDKGCSAVTVKAADSANAGVSFTKYPAPPVNIHSQNIPPTDLIAYSQIHDDETVSYTVAAGDEEQFDIAGKLFDADFMYVRKTDSSYATPQSVTASRTESMIVPGSIYALAQGRCDRNGNIVEEDFDKFVTTGIMWGEGLYHIALKPGYRVYQALLYDRSGKVLNPYHVCPPDLLHDAWGPAAQRNRIGGELSPYYGIRLVIYRKTEFVEPYCETDETCMVSDKPLLSVRTWSDTGTTDWPSEASEDTKAAYGRFLENVDRIVGAEVPFVGGKIDTSDSEHKYYFLPGQTVLGIPYSNSCDKPSIVCRDISLYTYLTALRNRHTMAYTEKNRDITSSLYNQSYGGNISARHYYGMGGSLFVSYALGWDDYPSIGALYTNPLISGGAPRIPNVTEIASSDINGIQPMDYLAYELKSTPIVPSMEHAMVVTNVIYDGGSTPAYICVAEASMPTARKTMMTFQDFKDSYMPEYMPGSRTHSVWRPTMPAGGAIRTRFEFDQDLPVRDMGVITCKGDRASFLGGGDLYILVDSSLYDGITLQYRDSGGNYVDSNTADITCGYDKEFIDNWKIYRLTSLNTTLAPGRYRVMATNGTKTEYTYFEVISNKGSEFDRSRNIFTLGTNYPADCTVPYVFVYSSGGSFPNELKVPESGATSVTFIGSYNQGKMYVRGEYGQVAFDGGMQVHITERIEDGPTIIM